MHTLLGHPLFPTVVVWGAAPMVMYVCCKAQPTKQATMGVWTGVRK